MKKVISALTLGVLILGAPNANAHAILTDAFPKPKSVVSALPQKIWVEFDGNLIVLTGKKTNYLLLTDSKGKTIPRLNSYVGGARLTIEIAPNAMIGKVIETWRVVSEDGHPVTGSTYFVINPKNSRK